MRRILWTLAIIGILMLPVLGGKSVWAGQVDILINKLVEKGILTQEEAKALIMEMQQESVRQKQEIKRVVAESAKEAVEKETQTAIATVPEWIQKTTLTGDFRLRYQKEDRDDQDSTRNRYRIRARLAALFEVNDQWKAGIGVASGDSNPRSTNQTLSDTFSTKGFNLDLAYAQYEPFTWLKAVGGKFENPLWRTKDLMWDGDIRPEGGFISSTYKLSDNYTLFGAAGYWILEEFKASNDPKMYPFQAGIDVNIDPLYFKFAGSYYDFYELDGNSFDYSSGSNSTDAEGNLVEDYDALGFDAEVGLKLANYVPLIPIAAVFGQYINSEATDDDEGWLIGAKMGHKKVKTLWDWQIKYNYRELERDAWPDFLPDSDCYGGATNVEGSEIEGTLGIAKNVSVGIDYYDVGPIDQPKGAESADEEALQLFLLLKW